MRMTAECPAGRPSGAEALGTDDRRTDAAGGAAPMTNVFAVIGEHRERPDRLLLLDADGRFYTYDSAEGPPVQVEPTEEWQIDEVEFAGLFV
jgi:hypothetical protein